MGGYMHGALRGAKTLPHATEMAQSPTRDATLAKRPRSLLRQAATDAHNSGHRTSLMGVYFE